MTEPGTYGPEDLEYLLANKHFNELYPEEKEYVLQHIENESEYSELRNILLIMEEPEPLDTEPSPTMKDNLMSLHRTHHGKPSLKIWLNSLFNGLSLADLVRRPAFQLATVACLFVIGWLVMPSEKVNDLAEKPSNPMAEDMQLFEKDSGLLIKERSDIEPVDQELDVDTDKESLEIGPIVTTPSPQVSESEVILQTSDDSKFQVDEVIEAAWPKKEKTFDEDVTLLPEKESGIQMDMPSEEMAELKIDPNSNEVQLSSPTMASEGLEEISSRKLSNYSPSSTQEDVTELERPNTSVSIEMIELLYTSW